MDRPIPKDKKWMSKYFKTKTKKLFLKYFLAFGSVARFVQHSGERCTKRYVKKMKMEFELLRKRHEKARSDFDLDSLEAMEKGKFRLNYLKTKD